MTGEDVTDHAADLAERILDAVSRSDQDWLTIASCARELAALADAAGAARGRREPQPGEDA